MPWCPRGSLRANREDWEWKHDLVEVVVVGPVPDSKRGQVVGEVYDFMRQQFGRRFHAMNAGRFTTGARYALARYKELLAEGMSHDDAVEQLKSVVRWCKREWWGDPAMRGYCKPDSIFRKAKFHDRRTT